MNKNKSYLHNEQEALKIALKNEIKSRKFYLQNAEKLEESHKKTMLFLADEEFKHEEAIKEFSTAILKKEVPDIETGPEDESLMRSQEFFERNMSHALNKALESKSIIHIYELGMELEKDGYDFYTKAAKEATHDNIKKLFEWLAREEESHYHLLSNSVAYFKNPDHYFQDEEGWNFEGA